MKQTVNDMNNNELLDNLYKGCAAFLDTLVNDKDAKYDRIVFIGSHGTGKTTLANELSKVLGMPVVESVARETAKTSNSLKMNE